MKSFTLAILLVASFCQATAASELEVGKRFRLQTELGAGSPCTHGGELKDPRSRRLRIWGYKALRCFRENLAYLIKPVADPEAAALKLQSFEVIRPLTGDSASLFVLEGTSPIIAETRGRRVLADWVFFIDTGSPSKKCPGSHEVMAQELEIIESGKAVRFSQPFGLGVCTNPTPTWGRSSVVGLNILDYTWNPNQPEELTLLLHNYGLQASADEVSYPSAMTVLKVNTSNLEAVKVFEATPRTHETLFAGLTAAARLLPGSNRFFTTFFHTTRIVLVDFSAPERNVEKVIFNGDAPGPRMIPGAMLYPSYDRGHPESGSMIVRDNGTAYVITMDYTQDDPKGTPVVVTIK